MKEIKSKIQSTDKTGIIKKDGWYRISFGEINALNKSGVMFLIKNVDKLISSKESVIGERIAEGLLTGEANHPDFSGLSGDALVNKIMDIDKTNECCLIKGVEFVKTNRYVPGFEQYPTYEVYGWVKPYGPHGEYLKEALEERDVNVAFSIRSIATPYVVAGIEVREIIDISTWDWVHDPGYKNATQWNVAGVASVERYDIGLNLCMNGECALKLKEGMITGAFNNNRNIEKIVKELEKSSKNYNPILDLV